MITIVSVSTVFLAKPMLMLDPYYVAVFFFARNKTRDQTGNLSMIDLLSYVYVELRAFVDFYVTKIVEQSSIFFLDESENSA